MILIGRLVRSMRRHMRRVSWTAVFVAYLAHLLVTWGSSSKAFEVTDATSVMLFLEEPPAVEKRPPVVVAGKHPCEVDSSHPPAPPSQDCKSRIGGVPDERNSYRATYPRDLEACSSVTLFACD